MATYGNIPKIPKYHDQNLPGPDLQGLPHILAGVPGLCRVASCDDGYESRTNGKKQRGKQKSSKMIQDVSTVTKRCLNFRSSFSDFRRSLLHVSYDLTKSGKHGKRRSMSPFSKPHGCGSPGTTDIPWNIPPKCYILFMHSELQKKTLW